MRSIMAQSRGRHDWAWEAVTWTDDDGNHQSPEPRKRLYPRPWPRALMWAVDALSDVLKRVYAKPTGEVRYDASPFLGMIPKASHFAGRS